MPLHCLLPFVRRSGPKPALQRQIRTQPHFPAARHFNRHCLNSPREFAAAYTGFRLTQARGIVAAVEVQFPNRSRRCEGNF